jgi:hypothetical protein
LTPLGVTVKVFGADKVPVRPRWSLEAETFPAASVALTTIRLSPTFNVTLQENAEPESVPVTPPQVTRAVPDKASVALPVIVTAACENVDMSAGALTAITGGVMSRFTETLAVAESPAVSVTVPVTV